MLDTLTIVKKMTAAGMPTAQAEAVAETLVETIESELATKRDVAEIRRDLKEVEAQLSRDLKGVEAKLSRDIKEVEATVSRDLKGVDAKLSRDLKEIDSKHERELKSVEANLKRDIKELELKAEKLNADTQRHTLQVGIAMAALIITVLGFLFRFLAR